MSAEVAPVPPLISPAAADVPPRVQRAASFASHAKLISALTLASRLLGLARENVAARYFGASAVWSAFTVAFKVPNLFRKLLGEGALSAAFIPLYAKSIKADGAAEANRFAAEGVTLLALILVGLTVVGEALLGATAAWATLSRDDLLTLKFTAVMLPYVLLVCGTAFLGGILQVHKRFGLPAATPVVLNVVHIAVIVIGARALHLRAAGTDLQTALQTRLAYWLAVWVLVAGVAQIGMLVPALRAVGLRTMLVRQFWTPPVRKMLKLSVPVAIGAGVLQLSVLLDTAITLALTRGTNHPDATFRVLGHAFAYPLAVGAVARLNWAQFLYQFPLGVFATAIATAIFPSLSADALDKDQARFRAVLRQGIIATLFEGFAASLGLILVRYPAVRLLYQHGNFTPADTHWVALSTAFYAAAIWAFSVQQILNRAYYAMHDTTTPLVLAVITIAINTVVEIPLAFTRFGEAGIAAGTLASFALQAVVMLILLDRRVGGLGLREIAIKAAKMLLACCAMAAACWAVQKLPIYPRGTATLASAAQLATLMLTGGAAYLGTCAALGIGIKEALRPGK